MELRNVFSRPGDDVVVFTECEKRIYKAYVDMVRRKKLTVLCKKKKR